MHGLARSIENALDPQGATPVQHGAVRPAERVGYRGRRIEIQAFQKVRILICRPQRPAIDRAWNARVLRIFLVGIATIPDDVALGLTLCLPAAKVPRTHDPLQAGHPAGRMVATPDIGWKIVGERFAAVLAGDVLNAARPPLPAKPPPRIVDRRIGDAHGTCERGRRGIGRRTKDRPVLFVAEVHAPSIPNVLRFWRQEQGVRVAPACAARTPET